MVNPLVTLADYKTYKKITKTDADQELQYIIDSINTLVKTFVGHTLVDYYIDPVIETFNIKSGQYALQLTQWPIKEVVSIETRQSYNLSYEVLDSTLYYIDPATDSVYLHYDSWPEGFGAVKVTYKAGYATTPTDIRIATLDLVHHYFKEEYKDRKQIGNASIDNTNRYVALASEWPIHIIRVLSLYRNV